MAENFSLNQKTRAKRKNNFMGTAREIKEIPIPEPQETPVKTDLVSFTHTPLETNVDKLAAEVVEATTVTPDEQLKISKGFIVGYTDEGKVVFKPIAGTSRLELVGLVAYSNAISNDLLDELAGTKANDIPVIKSGIEATLRGMQALLTKEKVQVAS